MMATLQKKKKIGQIELKNLDVGEIRNPLFTPVKGVVFKQGFRFETGFIARRNCWAMSSNVRIELIYKDVINVLLNHKTNADKVTKG